MAFGLQEREAGIDFRGAFTTIFHQAALASAPNSEEILRHGLMAGEPPVSFWSWAPLPLKVASGFIATVDIEGMPTVAMTFIGKVRLI